MQFCMYVFVLLAFVIGQLRALNTVWNWQCNGVSCRKELITDENAALSLPECRLKCSMFSAVWPMPNGEFSVSSELVMIDPNQINVVSSEGDSPVFRLIMKAIDVFKTNTFKQSHRVDNAIQLNIAFTIEDQDSDRLTLHTNEGYSLKIDTQDKIWANITAKTFFGARHALETLSQLIVFDDLRNVFKMPKILSVEDKPAYPYRGILLDTSRNYISPDVIKRTIDGMGASKLNTFHWHITDTHSFPYESKSLPDLAKYGAYSPTKIYSAEIIADIMEFAKVRGVRVLPEFDAPAHVGEGWQATDFVACLNRQPWIHYCGEPPCGQFDPTKPELYNALEALYGDMLEQFQPDIFHMGGDEVHFGCWNHTDSIVQWMIQNNLAPSEEGFISLWDKFQTEAAKRLYKKAGREIPIILWTSMLTTKKYAHHLPNDKYIIQVWTSGRDRQIQDLLDRNYTLILSNYDALYMDCGFASWVSSGNNWCSPYIGWQKVYDNSPSKIAGERKHLILGSEATLWTEEADDSVVDSRLWPRVAAMAEHLWSEPTTGWREAEQRFLVHRERLVHRGIAADALQPEWCWQNENNCPAR